MTERIAYDEFGYFHENADEMGIPFEPPTVRRDDVAIDGERRLSALVWGTEAPEVVFLHGGAQNAHTWDSVALALRRPMVAIDLPGHGHSDGPREGSNGARDNAEDVAAAIRQLAPDAAAVVGMSLGGLTSLALADAHADLVRALVLVDITPGVTGQKSRAISDFINGPASFASFDELLERTIKFNPTRSVSSLRRGILHNALQLEDGTWVWRYARHRRPRPEQAAPAQAAEQPAEPTEPTEPRFNPLWNAVSGLKVRLMLVRGMRPQSVVDDADEAELLRRCPSAKVVHVEEAGHSVQGDTPLELANLIDEFVSSL